MEEIFNAFFTTRPGDGYGAGYQPHEIIESHGGRLLGDCGNKGRGGNFPLHA
jgi:hypothetical protein